jgi:hypothetical protein
MVVGKELGEVLEDLSEQARKSSEDGFSGLSEKEWPPGHMVLSLLGG